MAEDFKPSQPERLDDSKTPETPPEAAEDSERLAELEAEAEGASEAQAELLREAHAEVVAAAKPEDATEAKPTSEQARPADLASAKRQVYTETLSALQAKLPKTAAGFSRLIHRPLVEKISEATAKTLMRPSLTLGMALGTMLGGGTFLYLASRHGFGLTGGEFLLSAGVGGLLGLLIEGLSKLIRRGKRRP